MTDEYIDLSVYALTGWLLYVLYLTYIYKSEMYDIGYCIKIIF